MARASSLMQRGPQSSSQIALSFVGLLDTDFSSPQKYTPSFTAKISKDGERGDSNDRQAYAD
jgi:hypothetical protein